MQEVVVGKAISLEQKRLEQAMLTGVPEEKRIQLDALLTSEDSLYQLTLFKREPKDFSYQEIQKEVSKRGSLIDLYQLATQFLKIPT
jgi:hypothetical protein